MAVATLLNSEPAAKLIGLLSTDVGRYAQFGDPAVYRDVEGVYNHVNSANLEVEALMDKLKKVIVDPTRPTPVEKHAFMREAFWKAEPVFTRAQAAYVKRATEWQNASNDLILEAFKTDASRTAYGAAMLPRINELVKSPEGMMKLRAGAKESKDLAIALIDAPSMLLDMSDEFKSGLLKIAIDKYAPNAPMLENNSNILAALAAKYPQKVRDLRLALYNETIADQIKLRVEN